MIVRMKKVTLLALGSEENQALTALRRLGIMQVTLADRGKSSLTEHLTELRATGNRIYLALQKYQAQCKECGKLPADPGKARAGAEVIEQGEKLFNTRTELTAELTTVEGHMKQFEAWGNFDRAQIEELSRRGIWIYLCNGDQGVIERVQAEYPEVGIEVITAEKARNFFVVISSEEIASGSLPEVQFEPQDNLPELRERRDWLESQLRVIHNQIDELLVSMGAVARRLAQLESELEFSRVSDSLAEHGAVVSLCGFVPAPAIPELEDAAKKHGWALLIEDPAPGDRVPTLRKNSRLVKLIEPLFQFLQVEPGYDEIDTSAGVLIFFTIFYAMIVGDAGYGLIFLFLTLLAALKFRRNPAARNPLALFGVLSTATIIWGVMSSNFFGLGNPEFLKWAEVPQLTDPDLNDRYIQQICFTLALLQLSLGHFWRAIYDATIRSFFGNLGWVFFLIGNYILIYRLLVFPAPFPSLMYGCFILGFLLVAVCGINWKDAADVFQFPFAIINCFVDILSYVRLFAVGLAGYSIATSFNDLGMMVFHLGSPWLTVLPAVIVILAGHLVNIALCIMGVLVHGVRLNTLEFSSHVGLSWGGTKYRPFQNTKKTEEG